MSFVLLSSTYEREDTADIIISKDKVSSLILAKITVGKEQYFNLKVHLTDGVIGSACFNKKEESLHMLKELGVPEKIIKKYYIIDIDLNKSKEKLENKQKMMKACRH